MRSNFFGARGFVICLCFLILCKLWLIQAEEICVGVEPYDGSWFLTAAKNWYWGAPYSRMAFIRPGAYPLWIAFVHLWHFPLRIAIELLQIGGCLVLVAALRAAGLPRAVSVVVFAAMIFHPASFQLNNYVRSDTFYAGLLSFALGGLLLTALSARVIHAVWAGLAFAILWNTREESILLPVLLAAFVAFVWLQETRENRLRNIMQWRLTKPLLTLCGTLLLVNTAIAIANYSAFRSFAKSEINSAAFKSAYKALLRIKPEVAQRFVPVARSALERAYGVSPAFAQLKPELDGKSGDFWRDITFKKLGVANEFGAGWFVWALRQAAEPLHIYKNPRDADRFYRTVAQDINRACDQGRIPSRVVFFSFLHPAGIASLQHLPGSFLKIARRFTQRYQIFLAREIAQWPIDDTQRALYNEMASRREALTSVATIRIIGATSRPADPVKFVAFRNTSHDIEAATDQFVNESDLIAHSNLPKNPPSDTRFVLRVPLRRSQSPAGDLVFFTQNGAEFSAPLAAILAGQSPTAHGVPGAETLSCWIRSQKTITPSHKNARAVENFIGNYYRFFVIALSYLGAAALVTLLFRVRRVAGREPLYAALILFAITIASRVGLFSYIDATSWPGDEPRYSFPVMPLYSAFTILLIYQAWRTGKRTTRSPPAPHLASKS